jgi:hypothetical protein
MWWYIKKKKKRRIPHHDSTRTGAAYTMEIVNHFNPHRFRECAKMDIGTFKDLVRLLRSNDFQDSMLKVEEQVLIFISVISGNSQRLTAEMYQHSTSTISSVVKNLFNVLLNLSHVLLAKLKLSHKVIEEQEFVAFKGCIGALDGTHIPAIINSPLNAAPFWNRKQALTQNVLGVVDFDMNFTYVLAGWEGSAHDGRVLRDAMTRGLKVPAGTYYLGDCGYALSSYTLTPYRRVRYHLKEWGPGALRPQNKEELFNLRHAKLRNVVERTYGVVKKRFKILKLMPSYSFEEQVKLVKCCFLLHNFINVRENGEEDDEYEIEEAQESDEADEAEEEDLDQNRRANGQALQTWRNTIANDLWVQYNNNSYNNERFII